MSKLYLFTIPTYRSERTYDLTVAACTIQGIFNRNSADRVYVLDSQKKRPAYWLNLFSAKGGWMADFTQIKLDTFDTLAKLALKCGKLKGKVIWDPAVPATLNAATTIAGVKDYVVLSPGLNIECSHLFGGMETIDLRGKFDGSVTGSAKNDVYRYMISEYLEKGLCSDHLLCLYEDSASARRSCNLGYVVTRDWAVYNRAFTYDLSPWGDEIPKDDPNQPLGCDLETYNMLLEAQYGQTAGKKMCEVAGFFAFWKYSNVKGFPSKHHPVASEWETVYMISPYNCYQNTVAHACYNQSVHSMHGIPALHQGRPAEMELENKCYVCIHMADYDSTTPLYDFMPDKWNNASRGKLPLGWGINPNLMETYPDIFEYLYAEKSENDWFVADASAAGYFNPNRIRPEHWDMVAEHNKFFYHAADMSVSPMVLDWEEPTALSKDQFAKFSPDGYSTIIMDMHGNGGKAPEAHIWGDMPVDSMYNDACNWAGEEQTARNFAAALESFRPGEPSFAMIRMVWITPEQANAALEGARALRPDLDIVPVDPFNYFALLKKKLAM